MRNLPRLASAALLSFPLLVAPVGAQEARETERARRIATADSIRETMLQPPGDREGLTGMDAVRAPFQVLAGAFVLGLAAGAAAWELLDETGVVDGALGARAALADAGLEVEVDFIGSRSWPALVLTYRGLRPFFVRTGVSVRRYQLHAAGLRLGDGETGIEASGTFRNRRELHFWGVGPDSRREDRSDYAHSGWEVGAWGWSDFGGPLRAGFGAAWEDNDVGRGFDADRPDVQDTFDPRHLYGSLGRTRFLRLDGTLDADFIRVVGLQPRGVGLHGVYQVFRGRDGTDAAFHRAALDLRGHVPVTDRQSLALRLLAEDHLAESGAGVPFTHLADLGDDDGLRGYGSHRFRDRALAAATAEWRYEVGWHPGRPDLRVEGFLFVDHGAVGPSLDGLRGADFRTTPGLGLRLTEAGEALAETFLAFGGDGPRLDVSLGGTF